MLNVILAVIVDSISDDGELEDIELARKNLAISKSIKYAIKSKRKSVSERASSLSISVKDFEILQGVKSQSIPHPAAKLFSLEE